MEVVISNNVKFSEVPIGEAFIYNETLWVKMKNLYDYVNSYYVECNAVAVAHNVYTCIADDTMVRMVKAKIVVE